MDARERHILGPDIDAKLRLLGTERAGQRGAGSMIARQHVSDRPIRFGTRGSALAIAQTELVIARFQIAFPEQRIAIRTIKTEGDLDKTSPLTSIGGRGVFTNAIQSAVLAGDVDAAVHSAKDLPTALDANAPIVAYPMRDDPRDVLVSRHGTTLDRLPPRPVIGTSSRRREVQVLRLRPDARIVNLRGNIDTRLRKAEGPELDAIVLAAAGLHRMGWKERICEVFSIEEMVPSPAQGALAVQALAGSRASVLLQDIDDRAVSGPVAIERAFLAAIGAGCTFPVGAFAENLDGGYRLVVMLANGAGDRVAFADERLHPGHEYVQTAELAGRLRTQLEKNSAIRSGNCLPADYGVLRGARVVVTRPKRQAEPLIAALAAKGAEPFALPAIRIEPVAETQEIDDACATGRRGAFAWIVFTSTNAVDAFETRLRALAIRAEEFATVNVAAVGRATAAAARDAGLCVKLVPGTATAEALAAELVARLSPGDRVLYPCSAIGRDVLPDALLRAGAEVTTVPVYRTLPELEVDAHVLGNVRRGDIDLIAFSSPSSVRNLVALLGEDRALLDRIPVVSAGPITAAAARDAGFRIVAVSDDPGVTATTNAITEVWRTRNRFDEPRESTAQCGGAALAFERSTG